MTTLKSLPLLSATKSAAHRARAEFAWVGLLQAGIMALMIAIGLLIARHLPVPDYGRFSYFINMFGGIRLLGAIGLTSQVVYALSQVGAHGKALGSQFYPLTAIRVVSLGVMSIVLFALSALGNDIELALATAAAVLALTCDFMVGALQGMGLVKRAMTVLGVQPALYAIGAIATVWLRAPVQGLYLAYGLSFIPALLLAGGWLLRRMGRPDLSAPVSWKAMLGSLRFASGMYGQAILGTTFTSIATLYFGSIGQFHEAALITIPLNLVFMSGLIIQAPLDTIYFPRLSRLLAAGETTQARDLFTVFCAWVSSFTVLILAGALAFPHSALTLLYSERYSESANVLAALAPVAVVYTLHTVAMVTVVSHGRWRDALRAPLVASIVLVVGVVIAAQWRESLLWVALLHSLAAAVGLALQLPRVGFPLRPALIQTLRQAAVAGVLFGVARLIAPDGVAPLWHSVVAAAIASGLYALWAWRSLAAGQAAKIALGVT